MRRLTILALGASIAAAIILTSAPSFASSVEPTHFQGTAACSSFSDRWAEVKAAPRDGTYSDGTLTATITTFDGTSFDWSSNITLDAVLVSGPDGAGNFYRYEPDQSSDSGMQAPLMSNGSPASIVDVVFCYGPSNVPNPSPTATPTVTPSPSVLPTSTSRPAAPSAEVKGEQFLAASGFNASLMVLAGFALLLMGGVARAIATRSAPRKL